jgi:hypothetical protein
MKYIFIFTVNETLLTGNIFNIGDEVDFVLSKLQPYPDTISYAYTISRIEMKNIFASIKANGDEIGFLANQELTKDYMKCFSYSEYEIDIGNDFIFNNSCNDKDQISALIEIARQKSVPHGNIILIDNNRQNIQSALSAGFKGIYAGINEADETEAKKYIQELQQVIYLRKINIAYSPTLTHNNPSIVANSSSFYKSTENNTKVVAQTRSNQEVSKNIDPSTKFIYIFDIDETLVTGRILYISKDVDVTLSTFHLYPNVECNTINKTETSEIFASINANGDEIGFSTNGGATKDNMKHFCYSEYKVDLGNDFIFYNNCKNKTDSLIEIARLKSVPHGNIILIDNNQENIQSALNAGFKCIYADNNEHDDSSGKIYIQELKQNIGLRKAEIAHRSVLTLPSLVSSSL